MPRQTMSYPLTVAQAATGVGTVKQANALHDGTVNVQISGRTTTGTGTATVLVEGSLDGNVWTQIGTTPLTLGVTTTSAIVTVANTRLCLYRVNVTALTGTGATIDAVLGG